MYQQHGIDLRVDIAMMGKFHESLFQDLPLPPVAYLRR